MTINGEAVMVRGRVGRPRGDTKAGESYALAEWLNKNLDRLTDLTDERIADHLGYSRPNIISMWRTGRTKLPLDQLKPLCDLLGVDFITLLPLWLEQYATRGDIKHVTKAAERLVSEHEAEFIAKLRQHTNGRPFKLRRGAEKQLGALLDIE